MKIVVADNVKLNEKDKQRLQSLGEVETYETHSKGVDDLKERLSDAEIGIILVSTFNREVLNSCEDLKMISLCCTGYDHVDLEAASDHGVVVSNVPKYADQAVGEHVFAMILSYIRNISQAHEHVVQGNYNWEKFQGVELKNKTLGIYGLGNIGSTVAKIAKGFGMNVIACTRNPKKNLAKKLHLQYVDIDDLLKRSDFLSIHAALKPETEKLFGREEFNKMKNSAILINTARGPIIDQDALVSALKNDEISGACLDVLENEPPEKDDQILLQDNVLLTPHMAFHTKEATRKVVEICIDNVESFINGDPINVVNEI